MKERAILFSAPMVRAILNGSKTQTRRVMKVQPTVTEERLRELGGWVEGMTLSQQVNEAWQNGFINVTCPYGQPGDRLWVRETWRGIVEISPPERVPEYGVARYVPDREHCRRVEYAATQERDSEPWRPSIHMPRWASRILLEVTGVRVERLQDISEEDAIAEGIDRVENNFGNGPAYCDYKMARPEDTAEWFRTPIDSYRSLWEQINGENSWEINPWVWVIEFKRIDSAALKQAA